MGHIAHWLFKELKNQEIHYHFIEPDNFSRNQILKEYSKYNVYHKKSEELKESQYDFIFLNHVLEHVENPMTFLDTYLRALKDIGHIYVETPNKDNLFKNSVFPHTLFLHEVHSKMELSSKYF